MASYALIFAIDDYAPATGQNDLSGAVADAAEFAEWALDANGGDVGRDDLHFFSFPAPAAPGPKLAAVLADPPDWPGPDDPDRTRAPDDQTIQFAAQALAQQVLASDPDGRIYLFFAGHGVRVPSFDRGQEPETCFIAGNYRPGSSVGMVPLGDVLRMMKNEGPAETIVFQDCCRSDLAPGQHRPELPFNWAPDRGYNNQWVLGNAAREGQVALEVPSGTPTRGAYTSVLMQALRQFRPEGRLTASALRRFVHTGVSQLVHPRTQQTELKMRYEEDDCVLVDGPAIGPLPGISVGLPANIATGTVRLFDHTDDEVDAATVNGAPLRFVAAPGLYYVEHEESQRGENVFHLGPEDSHVDIR